MKKNPNNMLSFYAVLFVIGLLALFVLPSLTQTAQALPPPRNTSTPNSLATPPPPQPTTTPRATPKSSSSKSREDAKPDGAVIELNVKIPPSREDHWPQLWTVVEWQDELGNWHDVTGWRGHLREYGEGTGVVSWWLREDIFGQGPFRWVVYQNQGGELLSYSIPFSLPISANQLKEIELRLPVDSRDK